MNISSIYRIKSYRAEGGGYAIAKITLPEIRTEDGEHGKFNRFYESLIGEYFSKTQELSGRLSHGLRAVLRVDFRVREDGSVPRKYRGKPYVFIERTATLSVDGETFSRTVTDIYDTRLGLFRG